MGEEDSFASHRGLLFGIAYRVLGSVADAEDVVQEAWVRWAAEPRDDVVNPRAYLATIATRLALNTLRTRRARREAYVGPWLPEPLVDPDSDDTAELALLADDVSMAFLVVLESLSPLERVVFVLHDLFGFEYAEVAAATMRTEPAVRQLASRARRHVRERRPRYRTDPAEHARVTAEFMRVAVNGDLQGLLALMAPDVVVVTDGGGARKAALRPIEGAAKAARFITAIAQDTPGVSWTPVRLNGRPGALVEFGGEILGTVELEVADGRISAVRAQLNPVKLSHLRSRP